MLATLLNLIAILNNKQNDDTNTFPGMSYRHVVTLLID